MLVAHLSLTAEFYKTFWNSVGHLLVDSLNYSYDHGELSNTQKQAIIKLIEKKRERQEIHRQLEANFIDQC